MIQNISLHVYNSDAIRAEGEVQEATGIPHVSLAFSAFEPRALPAPDNVTTIDVYLYGDPNVVWEALDKIIDACVDAKKAVTTRESRKLGIVSLNPDPLTVE